MPTNQQIYPSRTTVEASREFSITDETLTVEVVCAARVLEEYFTKLGYAEWILGGVCSRKLLDKVQQRVPNPAYDQIEVGPPPVPPSPLDNFTHNTPPAQAGGILEFQRAMIAAEAEQRRLRQGTWEIEPVPLSQHGYAVNPDDANPTPF